MWTYEDVLKVQSVIIDGYLAVLGVYGDGKINEMEELIFIDCESKRVSAAGLLEGPTNQMTTGPNGTVSVFSTQSKSVVLYKN